MTTAASIINSIPADNAELKATVIHASKEIQEYVDVHGWKLSVAKAAFKNRTGLNITARSKDELIAKLNDVCKALYATTETVAPAFAVYHAASTISSMANVVAFKPRAAKLVVSHELNRLDATDMSATDKQAVRGMFTTFFDCSEPLETCKALLAVTAKANDAMFLMTTTRGFFVTVNHHPVSGGFNHGNPQFAGSPFYTKIFETREQAQKWADDLMDLYSLVMVVPSPQLANYFNGENERQLKAGAWTLTAGELKAVLERDGIKPESVELRKRIETPEVYGRMQTQNMENGDDFHYQIDYCNVQVYVNGQYRYDVASSYRWAYIFEAHKQLEAVIASLTETPQPEAAIN